MKLLEDFFPLLAFFISYKLGGIYTATAVLMGACSLQVFYKRLKYKKFETMDLTVLGLALVFGSATLLLRDESFLKWKVTVVEWLFAALLLLAPLFNKNLLKGMLGQQISVPDFVWQRLNIAWGLSFLLLGAVNIYFIYYTSTETWVNFKVWGLTIVNLVSIVLTVLYISRYLPTDDAPKSNNEKV